jgi:hypothetical protein
MKVSSAGTGGGALRVNNSNGGMDYKVLLDGTNNYELRGGHIDLVTSPSAIAASTDINNPDFVLTKIVNVAGAQSTATTWVNPNLGSGEAGLGAADMSVTYSPFAGNRNIGEIVLQPGPNIRLDNLIFGQTYADAIPDFTWADPTTGGAWESPANWTGSVGIPNAAADKAIFAQPSSGAHAAAVTATGAKRVREIEFGGTLLNTARTEYTLDGSELTLADGGKIVKQAVNPSPWNAAVNSVIDNNLALEGDATLTNDNTWVHNARQLILNGDISGSGTVTVTGSGNGGVRLEGNNSALTGEIVLSSGMLLVGSSNSLGDTAGKTTTYGGQLWFDGGANTAENFVIAGDTRQASLSGNTQSGSFTVDPGVTFTVTNGGGNAFVLNGVVQGQGDWYMTAGGTRLQGTSPNTLSGKTTLDAGSTNLGFRTTTLSKPAGADAIAGDLDVLRNGRILWTADNQLADTASVLVDAAGGSIGFEAVLDLDGFDELVASLSLLNGGFVDTGDDGVFTVSALDVDTTSYGPGKYYSDNPFVTGDGYVEVLGAVVIPEPTTLLIWTFGLLLGWPGRRRR